MENGQAPQAPAVPEPLQQSQQVDDAIGAFANRYLDEVQADYQPEESDQQTQEQPPQETEAETPEAEAEAQPTEEVEALEIDGAEYQLPKALAERVKELKNAGLRQDDYTRKTQEVAESRKTLDRLNAEAERVSAMAKQLAPAYAQLQANATRIQQIDAELARTNYNEDPMQHIHLQQQRQGALQELMIMQGQVAELEGHVSKQNEAIKQQAMAEQLPSLLKAFPEIAKEEVRESLGKYARDEGLPESALNEIRYMPAAVKMLYKAMQYDKLVSQQAQAKQTIKSKVQAAPPVKGGKGVPPDARKQAMKAWTSRGGKFTDPSLDALLPKS